MVCDEMMGVMATIKTCNLDCDGDLIYKGQCCPDCVPAITPGCEVTYSNKTVDVGDSCRTVDPIALGECAGLCSSSVDSMLDNSCTCCQVSQTTSIQALIECRDSADAQLYHVSGTRTIESISQCECQRCIP
ncbi:uncharacterized protein LOC129274002 [Lytechinus pictus]|uniref:uncharacterized protein LOC129274002 n=1 Tax=Lytechinus pictus TaxID=7653 RepID=UPI0030B9E851